MNPLMSKEQLEQAAKQNLEAYMRTFNQISEEKDVSKRSLARVISIGITKGFVDNPKSADGFIENTLVELISKMQDCVFALKAIQLDEEAKKLEEAEKVIEKTAELPKGDLND